MDDDIPDEENINDEDKPLSQQQPTPSVSFRTDRKTINNNKNNIHGANVGGNINSNLKSFQTKGKGSISNRSKPPAHNDRGGSNINNNRAFPFHTQTNQQQQKQQQQPASPDLKSKNGIHMNMNKKAKTMNKQMAALEAQLADRMAQAQQTAQHTLHTKQSEQLARHIRYAIPRHYAYLVEDILAKYQDHIHVNLYELLQLPFGSEEALVKKSYRTLALSLHPDKNPHPDAKLAFDLLQDAYVTLSSTALKQQYEQEYNKIQRARRKRYWQPQAYLYAIRSFWQNSWSQILYMYSQWKQGEAIDDLIACQTTMHTRIQHLYHSAEHVVLLPSMIDRYWLLQEWWSKQWKGVVMVSYLFSLLL